MPYFNGLSFDPRRCSKYTVAVTMAAGTTGAATTHEILDVRGLNAIWIIPECTTNIAGTGNGILGTEDDGNALITTTVGTAIDADEMWLTATPAKQALSDSCPLFIISNGMDIGYTLDNTWTSGAIKFHIWWLPLENGANCVAGNGIATL